MKIEKREIGRRLIHIALGLIIVFLILNNLLTTTLLFLILVFGFILSVISIKYKIPGIHWFLKNFERDEYIHVFPGKGLIFFLIGVLLVMKLFNEEIALASIMVLTFGDGLSHLIGKGLGRVKFPLNGHKSLEGVIGGIIAGGIAAAFFVPIFTAFFGSLIGMSIEAIGLKMGNADVDDNVIVPLVAGTAIYLFQTNFSIFI